MKVTGFGICGHPTPRAPRHTIPVIELGECAMLSKCANPECSAQLRYLRQGKIFILSPTPEVQMAIGSFSASLEERFWLCDRCSQEMTLVWGGTRPKLVRLPTKSKACVRSALERVMERI